MDEDKDFERIGGRHWVFTARSPREEVIQLVWLLAALKCADRARYQGQAEANPYAPPGTGLRGAPGHSDGRDPGGRRAQRPLWQEQDGHRPVRREPITTLNGWHTTISCGERRGQGPSENRVLRHPTCHDKSIATEKVPQPRPARRPKGLSRMRGSLHVRSRGGGAVTPPPYPTPGWATTPVYPALCRIGVTPAPYWRRSWAILCARADA